MRGRRAGDASVGGVHLRDERAHHLGLVQLDLCSRLWRRRCRARRRAGPLAKSVAVQAELRKLFGRKQVAVLQLLLEFLRPRTPAQPKTYASRLTTGK